VGLRADHDSDVLQWDTVIKSALSRLRPPGFTPIRNTPPNGRARAMTPTPRGQSPRNEVKSRVFDFMMPNDGSEMGRSLSPGPTSPTSPADFPGSPTGTLGRSASASPVRTGNLSRQGTMTTTPIGADAEGWVTISTFNRFGHAGGRPWGKTDIALGPQGAPQMGIQQTWPPKKFGNCKKITSEWNHEDRTSKYMIKKEYTKGQFNIMGGAKPDFSDKVHVPDVTARKSIHRVREEYCAAHSMPFKITNRTKYGNYPNYKESKDRIFLKYSTLKSHSPDFVQDSHDKSPSHVKITLSPGPSPRSPIVSPQAAGTA